MVRSIHKTKMIILSVVAVIIAAVAIVPSVNAADPSGAASTNFNVKVTEVLTMTITEPASWASGDTGDFLTNKVNVAAKTNNANGVTVSMYTNDTNLKNLADNTKMVPTLDTGTTSTGGSSFPAGKWGYSTGSEASVDDKTYSPLTTSSSPVRILDTGTGDRNQDVFFGAKAGDQTVSGTYSQTVYFVAVTDVTTGDNEGSNPAVPVNPSGEQPTPNTHTATYSGSTGVGGDGQTVYTYTSTDGTTHEKATTNQVTAGDTHTITRSQPQGVTTSSNAGVNALAIGLAVSAAVAATSGTIFLVAAKRRNKDGEDE